MISHCRKHFQSREVFNNQFGGIVDGCFLQERNVQIYTPYFGGFTDNMHRY